MNLDKNQIKAINHTEGNCCVLASAGSGKTTVLVNRIARLIENNNINPKNILAITFSRKAATNMKDKLALISDKCGNTNMETFHSLGYKILKQNNPYGNEIIKDWNKKQIINNIVVKSLHLEDNEIDVKVNDIINFISYHKNNLIHYYDSLDKPDDIPYNLEVMRNIYKLYEEAKKKEGKIDFDDMLLMSYDLLNTSDKVRNHYQNIYKFILVDEMQDTNTAQYEIIRLLGKTNNNVFVVGDPLQNIYEWRSANNNYLLNFYKDWYDVKVVNLNTNYRSSDDIVKISNKLVTDMKETTHKFYIESKANSSLHKSPEFTYCDDEFKEADYISSKIKQLNSIYPFSDFSILTRTNFQLQAIERKLYSNNIPYEIIDGNSFYDLKEIKDMISYLKLVDDNDNNDAYKNIFNSPNRYLGKVFLDEVSTYAEKKNISLYNSMLAFPRCDEWRYKKGIDEIHYMINKLRVKNNSKSKKDNVGNLIRIIRDDLNYDKYISKENYENNDKNEKIENLDSLVSVAEKYKTIREFLEEIDKLMEFNKNSESDNKVKVMTIHKSKGLEFKVVFVVGVNQTLLPHSKSKNENEERRLFYVALTRAEKELYISATKFYRDKISNFSNFIYDIFDEEYVENIISKIN